MKRVFIKGLACILLALSVISTISMIMPVSAASIEPYSYYENTFSFKGSCNIARSFDGAFLSFKVKGTAANNNNETVHLKVFIEGSGATKNYTFLTDGQYHQYNNIFLGFKGSGVVFNFNGQNPDITLTLTLEAGN